MIPKVGGIQANNSYPADFLLENLKIQTNVIETAWRSAVRRLLFLASSCIYPKIAEQPIREDALLTGPLEPTNSHVLPPLREFEFLHVDDLGEACVFALEHWQPGPEELQFLNVGTGVDLTIRELAEAVAAATGFQGEIHWDTSKPDGTPKKQLDVSRLAELGWRARIPIAEGLASTVALFREQLSLHLARL